jgi:hypothetical protein
MKVQVTEMIELPNGQPWITGVGDNIHEADRWEADEFGVLTLFRGAQQVASFRHWTSVREQVEASAT